MCEEACPCVARIHVCVVEQPCVQSSIYTCDVTHAFVQMHSYVWRAFMCVSWFFHVSEKVSICVPWRMYKCAGAFVYEACIPMCDTVHLCGGKWYGHVWYSSMCMSWRIRVCVVACPYLICVTSGIHVCWLIHKWPNNAFVCDMTPCLSDMGWLWFVGSIKL